MTNYYKEEYKDDEEYYKVAHFEWIIFKIISERKKQDDKWGEQNHDAFKWLAILGEEVGEVNKAVLEKDEENIREELIQIAATAIAMYESLERNKK